MDSSVSTLSQYSRALLQFFVALHPFPRLLIIDPSFFSNDKSTNRRKRNDYEIKTEWQV